MKTNTIFYKKRATILACATLAAPGKGIKTDKGNLMIGVGDLHTPQSMKEEIIKNNRFKSHSTN